mmetsp:Transcript_4416/g.9227  ORF Transcript_4416/g.9227 Transcript_4416/m.9227 type:complete len:287 (-) Transcript_4416:82-942(-)|eukprot:CAMPEP_0194333554 /NCGR_PEP_ID=MMETSP0171-20130528/63077_1 /TAXON_ID=218684 /ORGANISM="Corethron pennatum, Strain L29A3" /LENGTH=286 /DNA_ID=CAMNT_0039095831 /DNA_START=56 /DNA_END=916 /DNA_ORIENTATION=+
MDELLNLRELDPRKHLIDRLESGDKRSDGRGLRGHRPTSIAKGILRDCAGSALVTLGGTKIIAAITLEVGRPPASHPQRGEIDVSLSVANTCRPSPYGRDDTYDVGSAESFVRRTLRSSSCVDREGLCISEGRSSWKVRADVVCLCDDGNLADVALVAAVAALSGARIPEVDVSENDGVVRIKEGGTSVPLELRCVPTPLTFGIVGSSFLVDPTREEAAVADGFVTVVANADGGIVSVCVPGGGAALSPKQLATCMKATIGRAKEVDGAIKGHDNGGDSGDGGAPP